MKFLDQIIDGILHWKVDSISNYLEQVERIKKHLAKCELARNMNSVIRLVWLQASGRFSLQSLFSLSAVSLEA